MNGVDQWIVNQWMELIMNVVDQWMELTMNGVDQWIELINGFLAH